MTKVPPKFKIGDLVVPTVTKWGHLLTEYHPKNGDLATVKRIDEYYSSGDHVYFFDEYECGRFASELELSPLSGSPLWEALK